MKTFVVYSANGEFRTLSGLKLAIGQSGRKKGFKKFWMATPFEFDEEFYLSREIQESLPEVPETLSECRKIKIVNTIDDIDLIKHPSIPGRWMAVRNNDNKAMVMFSKRFIGDVIFQVESDLVAEKKDCPYNHMFTYSSTNVCSYCGEKGIRPVNDEILVKLADKHNIEIGTGKLNSSYPYNDFLHINDGKVNVIHTKYDSFWGLTCETDEMARGDCIVFILNENTPISVCCAASKTFYILELSYSNSSLKMNVKNVFKNAMLDFRYKVEVDSANRDLEHLIKEKENAKDIYSSSSSTIAPEDSPFAALKGLKFDN